MGQLGYPEFVFRPEPVMTGLTLSSKTVAWRKLHNRALPI